jgi:hypothetical protein
VERLKLVKIRAIDYSNWKSIVRLKNHLNEYNFWSIGDGTNIEA